MGARTRAASTIPFGRAWIFVAVIQPACALSRSTHDNPSSGGSGAESGASGGASGGSNGPVAGTSGSENTGGSTDGAGGLVGGGSGGTSSGTGGGGASAGSGGETPSAGGSSSAGETSAGGGATAGGGSDAGGDGNAGSGPSTCGNGQLDSGEECDDEGTAPGDGCSQACAVESGWSCSDGAVSVCTPTHPSCKHLDGDECAGETCCASLSVAGGSFTQGHGSGDAFEATVSNFQLDKYEVSVARFRAFVNDYDDWLAAGNPRAGAGEHPRIPGSGWNAEWPKPFGSPGIRDNAAFDCESSLTWAGSSGNDALPANCVDWYNAFLFCVWDGGRLPTESEWEYAAVGGSEEFLYAWGNEPVLTGQKDGSEQYAVYNCLGDGSDPDVCDDTDIVPVGSRPAGAGHWGHLDLNGSLAEWTLDWSGDYPSADQTDYANIDEGDLRVYRGGSWPYDSSFLTSVLRVAANPLSIDNRAGFRCARGP